MRGTILCYCKTRERRYTMRHSYAVNMANSVQLHGAAAGVILRPEPSSTAANPAGRVQNHMRGSLKTQRALPLADLPKREKLSQEPISDISVIVANTQHYLNYF